jgi:hypothetical protein
MSNQRLIHTKEGFEDLGSLLGLAREREALDEFPGSAGNLDRACLGKGGGLNASLLRAFLELVQQGHHCTESTEVCT